jgi:hypothetical protein
VARAAAKAAGIAPVIAEIQAAGVTTLQGIADELNRRRIPTAARTRPVATRAGLSGVAPKPAALRAAAPPMRSPE